MTYITTPHGRVIKTCIRCGDPAPADSDYCRPCLKIVLREKA